MSESEIFNNWKECTNFAAEKITAKNLYGMHDPYMAANTLMIEANKSGAASFGGVRITFKNNEFQVEF